MLSFLPTRSAAIVAMALSLTLAGCGGGGDDDPEAAAPATGSGGGGGGGGTTLPTTVDYRATARPLNVDPSLDTSAGAVTEVDVPLAGATLAVTGSNGTRYSLAIPVDALRSPTRIRMQALDKLMGLPAGVAAVHGVQLEPAGLHFLTAATLTITPVSPPPVAQQAFFAYRSGGTDLHATPGGTGAAAQLAVWHFSGYGMAALERERSVSSVFVDVVPAGLEARLQSAMAAAFMQARDGRINDAELAAAVDALLTQYRSEVLRPQHIGAAQSCANAVTAFTAELAHGRQRQLLGLADAGTSADALETAATLRRVCFDDAEKRCRVSGNIQQLIADHRGLARQSELLSIADAAATAREEAAIDKCGRYEFQFDSTLTIDAIGTPNAIGFARLSVATRVPIKLNATLDGLEGQAEIAYTDTTTRFNCAAVGCSYYLVQSTRPDTALVSRGVPTFLPMQGIDVWALGKPVAQAGSFSVEFDPQKPGESIDVLVNLGAAGVVNANRAGGLPPTAETLWAGFYSLVNQGEVGPRGAYLWASDWSQPTYPAMFERATAPSLDNPVAHLIAITRARLVHKPA